MKFEAILATALLLAVSEAAPDLKGMKRVFSLNQVESEATEEAMLKATREAMGDMELVIKTMATSRITTRSRTSSQETQEAMGLPGLLEQRAATEEDMPEEAMAEVLEDMAISRLWTRMRLPWKPIHWILRSEGSRYNTIKWG
jgi:hypothetical protein